MGDKSDKWQVQIGVTRENVGEWGTKVSLVQVPTLLFSRKVKTFPFEFILIKYNYNSQRGKTYEACT